MPIREVIGPDQFHKQFKIACAQGGVFSSIILKSLIYPQTTNDFSFDHFTDSLVAEFKNIERDFIDIFIKQNTIEESFQNAIYPKEGWKLLKTMYKHHPKIMENYFKTNFKKSTISISSRDFIPINYKNYQMKKKLKMKNVIKIQINTFLAILMEYSMTSNLFLTSTEFSRGLEKKKVLNQSST